MIFYNIQHFGDTRWLPWLVKVLEHPRNSVLITYDGSEEECATLAALMARTPVDARRLEVERSLPVRWCGPSQIVQQMQALRRALDYPDWRYFINLSGTCFPLRSQREIRSYLKRREADGIRAHLFAFHQQKPVTLPREDPAFPLRRARVGRLLLEGNGHLLDMFADPDWMPVRHAANRLYIGCHEPEDTDNLLAVSRPDPEELAFRQAYLRQYPHYLGRAWYTLHRSVCARLVRFFDSPGFADTGRLFLNCFEPDESFLQTIVMNGLAGTPDVVSTNNHRTFQGTPTVFSDATMDRLQDQKQALFGRKLDHADGAALRAHVEKLVTPSR